MINMTRMWNKEKSEKFVLTIYLLLLLGCLKLLTFYLCLDPQSFQIKQIRLRDLQTGKHPLQKNQETTNTPH